MEEILNKENLSHRIWVTKKSRMNAEARYSRIDFFTSFLVAYYSVTFLCFQLAPKYFENITNLSQIEWIATTCSIAVLIFSILMGSQGFKEKALRMKDSYNLLVDAELALADNNIDESKKKYALALNGYDNHWIIDYWKLYLFKKLKNDEGKLHLYYRHFLIIVYFLITPIISISLIIFPIYVFYKYICSNL